MNGVLNENECRYWMGQNIAISFSSQYGPDG